MNSSHLNSLEAVYSAAYHLLEQEQLTRAAAMFRLMMILSPGDERGWIGTARCHEAWGQDDRALALYMMGASAAGPKHAIELSRARLLRKIGAERESQAAFELAADLARESDTPDVAHAIDLEGGA